MPPCTPGDATDYNGKRGDQNLASSVGRVSNRQPSGLGTKSHLIHLCSFAQIRKKTISGSIQVSWTTWRLYLNYTQNETTAEHTVPVS